MAQRVQVVLEDDVDGGAADETVTFALDGADYEIDLSSANAETLREGLAPWVANARRTGGRRKRVSVTHSTTASTDTKEIREWANAQGLAVSARGRVSSEVRDAYAKAHR